MIQGLRGGHRWTIRRSSVAGCGQPGGEDGKVVSDGGGYLYRPAAGLIYLAFAGLVVLSRWLVPRGGPRGARARTARAADAALTGVVSGLTGRQRRSALEALAGSTRPV